jgi:hypothetical protein
MALLRRTKSDRERVARQRCSREAKVIKGRAREKVQAVKSAERLALKRLKSACRNNVREIRQTESGRQQGTAARRKATVSRRKTQSKMDQLFFRGSVAPSKKARQTREFYDALYGKRTRR